MCLFLLFDLIYYYIPSFPRARLFGKLGIFLFSITRIELNYFYLSFHTKLFKQIKSKTIKSLKY